MKRPWPSTAARLAAELTVIVVGVLVALAADRWNQGRQERAQADDYMARLVAELEADSARLGAHRSALLGSVPDGLALLEIVQGSAPDTTARSLQFRCSGGTPPHPGGATFNEILSVGGLGLLPPSTRQALFDYYGFVEGIQARIDDIRERDRNALRLAVDHSGAWMPDDVMSDEEFAERLRAYPGIDGLVMGCIAFLRGEAAIVNAWHRQLNATLEVVQGDRDRPPAQGR